MSSTTWNVYFATILQKLEKQRLYSELASTTTNQTAKLVGQQIYLTSMCTNVEPTECSTHIFESRLSWNFHHLKNCWHTKNCSTSESMRPSTAEKCMVNPFLFHEKGKKLLFFFFTRCLNSGKLLTFFLTTLNELSKQLSYVQSQLHMYSNKNTCLSEEYVNMKPVSFKAWF